MSVKANEIWQIMHVTNKQRRRKITTQKSKIIWI